MKRPLQLPLAIALALGVTDVLALGLGPVRVHSRLNQPLNAEIPVIQASPGEAEGLLVTLAGAEEFERIGLSRARVGVPLEFKLDKDPSGATVIRVTSQEPVRQAYLDFLVEANWPKGRLLREYTVLLDPPVTAPARAVAATPAPAAAPSRPAPSARPAPVREPAPVSAPRPAPAAAAAQTVSGDFGPVAAGQTLSQVARAVRPGEDLNRTMLALFKANPGAFYKDNINALKRGAILRVPDADEIRATGNAAEAAAQVQAQVEDWRGNRAAPTRVAEVAASSPATGSAASRPSDSERLELVPPKAGQDSVAMADTPGSGSGSVRGSAELRSELARTREALSSSEQESTELKSRVKELEDLKGKNDRLLSLKDSEIAELQQRLRELQATAGAAATPVAAVASQPASTPSVDESTSATTALAPQDGEAASTAVEIGKDDIWGTGGEAVAEPGAAEAGESAAESSDAAPATAEAMAGESTPDAAADNAPELATEAPAPVVAESAPTSPESAETTPLADADPAAAPAPDEAAPAAVAPATVSAGPWYMEPWVRPAAIAAGVLILLGALFGLRRRKAAPVERKSIADAFGDSPLAGNGTAEAPLDALDAEEADLRQRIAANPHDAGLYLELLSIHYASRRVEAFEQTAAEMHAIVDDQSQAEWLEAQAMGQELAPHNPLFGGVAVDPAAATGPVDEFDMTGVEESAFDEPAEAFPAPHEVDAPLPEEHGVATPPDIGGFEAEEVGQAEPVGVEDADDYTFGEFVTPVTSDPSDYDSEKPFGELPPLEFGEEIDEVPTATMADPELDLGVPAVEPEFDSDDAADDDFFSTTADAVGTKLDLARAYMDMGDPDGARSMLEEVVAEGDTDQQAEARRLMAEMG
ncbi:MAG: tetratricopeptide repeat protein [Xanthomonadales bacterium]|nr:tetratricopeptide repeat protein [Xanthomonadales bacterium]